MHAPTLLFSPLSPGAHETPRRTTTNKTVLSSVRPIFRSAKPSRRGGRSPRERRVRLCLIVKAKKAGTTSSPNDRYAVTSNPFYDVDTEKYSRQISEKANEKKRATADGNTGKTANGTSTVASSTVAKADFGGVVRERWEKVHLSSEDERAKGSADVSIVRLNENAFKMKMKLNCPSICLLYTSPSPRDLSTSRMPSSA